MSESQSPTVWINAWNHSFPCLETLREKVENNETKDPAIFQTLPNYFKSRGRILCPEVLRTSLKKVSETGEFFSDRINQLNFSCLRFLEDACKPWVLRKSWVKMLSYNAMRIHRAPTHDFQVTYLDRFLLRQFRES